MDIENVFFDLVIVGGGLAGNCLALALQGKGLNIALIEANSKDTLIHSPAGDRALALALGSVKAMENLGIWQAVSSKATAISDIHISDRGHFGKTRLSAAQQKVDALGYVITARDIERHVIELVEQSDIVLLSPARLSGISYDENKVNISVAFNGKSICLSSRLLVGADGGNSSVRNLLNIDQHITDYQQTAIVTTIRTTVPHRNTAYERFTESGPLALLPSGKNQCAVIWTCTSNDAEQLLAISEKEFTDELQQCFGYRLGIFNLTAPRRAFPLTLIRAEKMRLGRTIIIGNAMHQLHPVAGQGFNLGLRDVIQLAELISSGFANNPDIGDEGLLQAFVRARESDHSRTIFFTDTLVKVFSNDWLAVAAARNIGLTALDHLPLAKSILSKYAMGFNTK
jgi:2-octaprenyl-6-methoxyphenol hydroxylase